MVSANVRRSKACLAIGVIILAATFLFSARPAAADITGDFCGTSTNGHFFSLAGSPGDRCADGGTKYELNYVTGHINGGSAANFCALGKEYRDGTGSNETYPACVYSNYTRSNCGSGYSCNGYATVVNKDQQIQWYGYGYFDAAFITG